MKTQHNIEDIVAAAQVSGTETAHPTYKTNILGKIGKAVINCSLVALMGMSYLTACASPTATATSTPAGTDTPVATNTPAATATYTPSPTPVPLEGRLFFDMNGSGLQDEATFQYDPARLTDEKQPLQPDLLKAITDYVQVHPDLKTGDLITLEEPGLSGYTVCVSSTCDATDAEGNFAIADSGASSNLTITDPNAGTPALAMRYINKWNGAVVVPAYTKDVDAATMAKLKAIPSCDADAAALVCKQDASTLQVRDQHLNDTAVIPIDKGITVSKGQSNDIGLMQGFLTLPFMSEQVPKPFILGGFDIIGPRCFKSDTTFNSTLDGISMNYKGMYYNNHGDHSTLVPGVEDNHVGIDYNFQEGISIVLASPTATVIFQTAPPDPELRMNTSFSELISNKQYMDTYGHLDVYLVDINQQVYRGQIIGIGGTSGIGSRVPELHFDISEYESDAWCYRDQYRYIANLNPLPDNFWGDPVSMWSSDNNPQFSLSNQESK